MLHGTSEYILMASDASGEFGWGYHRVGADPATAMRGTDWDSGGWTPKQHSDWGQNMLVKELYPVIVAARQNGPSWRGRTVIHGTDNTGVVYGINAGRVHTHLGRVLMRELADLQEKHQFEILARWIPRELNEVADGLSRQMTCPIALQAAHPAMGA